ncbi:MAG TPA: energy-coupling factor transporter transmembrane protein EcfT [Clostridiales bacterium]|nr:energy-coupling factor transporter transmembrane protein EcfT [Clostridiales bacterium]
MKKADPRIKLLWIVLCTTAALIFSRPAWMAGLCLFSFAGALILGSDLISFAARFKRFLSLLMIIVLVQVLFVRTGEPVFAIKNHVIFTYDGLSRGMNTAMRLFVILCAASVMAGESSRRVIAALTKMGVPYLFSFMLMTALRFLPLFSAAFSDAITSIQLRGIQLKKISPGKKLRLYGGLLLPVVADAVVRAQDLAIAMEARGFGAMLKRTTYLDVGMTKADWMSLAAVLGIGAAAIICYYIL